MKLAQHGGIDSLTVLGPGTILPLPDYGCSGYLLHWRPRTSGKGRPGGASIKSGEGSAAGRPILIDCGSGTLDRLCEQGTSPEQIELILISHLHVDHVSDLTALLQSRWLRNLRRGAEEHRTSLVGPVGLSQHITLLHGLNGPWMSEYRFDIVELAGGSYRVPAGSPHEGLELRTTLTGHTSHSICFRIADEAGRTLFYSGDTDYNESLIPLAEGVDLAIFECSMPDNLKLDGHLTPRLAGRLAQKARAKHLLLTHFYEEVLEVDIAAEAHREYDGPVELAKKLQRYQIGRSSQT